MRDELMINYAVRYQVGKLLRAKRGNDVLRRQLLTDALMNDRATVVGAGVITTTPDVATSSLKLLQTMLPTPSPRSQNALLPQARA